MKLYRVRFLPDNLTVRVEDGTDLLRAAAQAGIELRSHCGGEGTCGRCAVAVKSGAAELLPGFVPRALKGQGLVPACRTLVRGDLDVEAPQSSRVELHQVLLDRGGGPGALSESAISRRYRLDPVVRKVELQLEPPSLTDSRSDLARLLAALKAAAGVEGATIELDALRRLPRALRDGGWRATALVFGPRPPRVIDVAPSLKASYGLAVDIGTTTVVTLLLDLETGATIDRRGTYNRQARFGDNVITRIIHAGETPGGLDELRQAVVDTINGLVRQGLESRSLGASDVGAVVVAGNTTMTHLFLGLPPDHIRLEPYIPVAATFPVVPAGQLGLIAHERAPVLCLPAVASYVGGDIVAGALATGIGEAKGVELLIDIGTNGELLLGNREWLMTCACSAGPCFEGVGITSGMRASPGAINRVDIEPQTLEVRLSTVGGAPPAGICGSGLVDALAKMRRAGIIDRAGTFQLDRPPRCRVAEDGPEFVLAWGEGESGPSRHDVVVRESDVKNVLRAKAAMFAGVRVLLRAANLAMKDIERVWIAGAFGNYINVPDAVRIGLLPDLEPERYTFVGNASIKGARLGLLSRRALEDAAVLARRMTYLELSAETTFMDEFMSGIFLPHTDLSLFPSVRD
jgi:uncharacterized 2Fe-2S/4Fe-4S cluster protein (DUF4445 family)